MTARKLAFLVALLCVPRLAGAQVDLSWPLPVDEHTIALFHLDDVADAEVQDAAGGPAGPTGDAVATLGRFGGALSCNGVGGWIDVPDRPEAAPEAGLTVECWVKFREKAGGDIICRNQGYMMRIGGTVQAYIGIDGTWRTVSGATAVPVNRWTHLAITYDRESKETRIYIDGKLDVARVARGVTAGELAPGGSVLRLGSNDWSAASSVLDGKLDEVRISSVARSYTPLHATEGPPIPENTNLVGNPGFESGMYGWRITREG
ncbi:MAG: LamG domain-containing protein, partial [Candidatus Brocadiae bacterium]|nr:LamG domain-containing protein [Candidatus Brocadiia bacterium]